MRADDALKYAAAILKERADWTLDAIGGSPDCHGHEIETGAIADIVTDIKALAEQFGDPRRYSDGRLVRSSREIETGLVTAHVWHPDPTSEQIESHRGTLLSGHPDVPSPGLYEVTTYPLTQEIHVRVVRTA